LPYGRIVAEVVADDFNSRIFVCAAPGIGENSEKF